MSSRGRFITFEGADGSGKTTISRRIVELLNANGIKAIWSREPGGTQFAEKLRTILFEHPKDPLTQFYLVMAARCDHVNELIRPQLEAGVHVVCDRFYDSTLAYQFLRHKLFEDESVFEHSCGHVRFSKRQTRGELHEMLYRVSIDLLNMSPDLTVYMYTDRDSASRVSEKAEANHFDTEKAEEKGRLWDAYNEMFSGFNNPILSEGHDRRYRPRIVKVDNSNIDFNPETSAQSLAIKVNEVYDLIETEFKPVLR